MQDLQKLQNLQNLLVKCSSWVRTIGAIGVDFSDGPASQAVSYRSAANRLPFFIRHSSFFALDFACEANDFDS